jgi:hypothetical protein
MKNKIEDVRNHLVAAMEALNADDLSSEAAVQVVEKAKAVSNLANSYINSVKVEIDAIRLADDVGMLPASIAKPEMTLTPRASLGRRQP